jgi:hypothetical protein
MKKLSAVVALFTALLLPACKPAAPPPAAPAAPAAPAKPTAAAGATAEIVSAEKNSFKDVTAHLDPGGSFYMYWSAEQVMARLPDTLLAWKTVVQSTPDFSNDQAQLAGIFDVLLHLSKRSGLQEISGVGMSSIAREKGIYTSKLMVHHYKGNQSGFLWSLAGKSQHALTGLDLLPATTAFAGFGDFDVPQLWSVVGRELEAAGVPKVKEGMQELTDEFQKDLGLDFEKTLASLGGEYGMVLTLNGEKMTKFPTGSGNVEFPEPGLVLVVKVKNDLIFNRVEAAVKDNPSAMIGQQDGARMIVMPLPLPIPVPVRPTIAQSGDYLLVASNDELVKEMLAIRRGSRPGLKSSAEFKKLAAGVPEQGNHFTYISPRLQETIGQIQRTFLAQMDPNNPNTAMAKFFVGGEPMSVYAVGANTEEGWLITANGTHSPASVFAGPAIAAPVGLLAAVAIPNFVKARNTAQKNACRANLRMLDGAMQQWALENNKRSTDKVAMGDLAQYLNKMPICPAGGTYSVTRLSEVPMCSHPEHAGLEKR